MAAKSVSTGVSIKWLDGLYFDIIENFAYIYCIFVLCSVSQLCPTLCNNPLDCSPPGSSVHRDSPSQNNWSGLPFPPPGDLPDPGIEPSSPLSPALAGRFFSTEPWGKPPTYLYCHLRHKFVLEKRFIPFILPSILETLLLHFIVVNPLKLSVATGFC